MRMCVHNKLATSCRSLTPRQIRGNTSRREAAGGDHSERESQRVPLWHVLAFYTQICWRCQALPPAPSRSPLYDSIPLDRPRQQLYQRSMNAQLCDLGSWWSGLIHRITESRATSEVGSRQDPLSPEGVDRSPDPAILRGGWIGSL